MSNCGCGTPSNSGCDPCRPATVVCDPNNEPLQSALDNFITQFFGDVTKQCNTDGEIEWVLPCDLATGIPGFEREAGEGLACYFKRIMTVLVQDILAGLIEIPQVKTYVLARVLPYAGKIQSISFATLSDELTFSVRINGVAVTGLSGLTATSTPATATATAANLWAIGDRVDIIVTALNVAPADFDFTISYQKQPTA